MEGTGRAGNEGLLDLEEVEERYLLGYLASEDMPDIALRALEDGHDGPALLELAWLRRPTMRDVGDLFDRALVEMGRSPLPKGEAGLRAARKIARKIVTGGMHPYRGARLIWTEVWEECGRPDELTAFVGLASQYEDDFERRSLYLREIVALAEKFVDNQGEG